ncbi:hypothetical protein JAAARDRAFT_309642 [Jaapia argillacea MUCL 33604]|uniref:Uncharacterized protein n=1 Tax=Jaapia argillacea MUCL 33604 TaxID=933084 RepID=A0A067PYI3_9AGAM|nr:hypothetical protein JAAARDRAFT_309642 [Jaapia argillacea MUCL 33604]
MDPYEEDEAAQNLLRPHEPPETDLAEESWVHVKPEPEPADYVPSDALLASIASYTARQSGQPDTQIKPEPQEQPIPPAGSSDYQPSLALINAIKHLPQRPPIPHDAWSGPPRLLPIKSEERDDRPAVTRKEVSKPLPHPPVNQTAAEAPHRVQVKSEEQDYQPSLARREGFKRLPQGTSVTQNTSAPPSLVQVKTEPGDHRISSTSLNTSKPLPLPPVVTEARVKAEDRDDHTSFFSSNQASSSRHMRQTPTQNTSSGSLHPHPPTHIKAEPVESIRLVGNPQPQPVTRDPRLLNRRAQPLPKRPKEEEEEQHTDSAKRIKRERDW